MKKIVLSIALLLVSGITTAQDYRQLLKEFLKQNQEQHFSRSGLSDFTVDNEDYSESMKASVLKLQQTLHGIPVFNGVATALIKEGKVSYFADNFVKEVRTMVSPQPEVDVESAFQKALKIKQISDHNPFEILLFHEKTSSLQHPAKFRLTYFLENQELKLGYEFHFHEPQSSNYWNMIVDANTGTLLYEQNLTLSCNFHNHNQNITEKITANKKENKSNVLKSADQAAYRVFPIPIESPNFGNRFLVTNPWFADASPQGWHSVGNTVFTITRGNNVYAYEDQNAKDSPGFSPDGGSARVFDFPLNLDQPPNNHLSASVTQLFYSINKSHDIFYRLGFTETARNFQNNNFGKGGLGNDEVLAESQDLSDQNNSTFYTPPEGTNPRMQMFLWSSQLIQRLFYNQPVSAAVRQPVSRPAAFGSALTPTGITGDVAIAPVLDACSPFAPGILTGKIGLAERGNCNFTEKVKNMQNAGAIAAVIYNAASSTDLVNMGGTDTSITIPSVLIEHSEGEFIKNTISSGQTVNITLKEDSGNIKWVDGSFDNGIIIHEYGHGITNRLTGNGYSCLNKNISKEQMGEGWSDFFALMLTNQPGAAASVPRSIGSFAVSQNADGIGIRPAEYSPDFSINNYTYGKTNGMEFMDEGKMVPDVHSIGFVWATILWDLHWKFVEKYGYSADVMADNSNGSTRVLQTVLDALKLQECNPNFISGRDAVIAADIASTNGENRCMIWETFARRGVGAKASAGLKADINDQTEDFSVPAECGNTALLSETELKLYPNPAGERYYIRFPLSMFGKVFIEIYDAAGRRVQSEERLVVQMQQEFSTGQLTKGLYYLKIKANGKEKTLKLLVAR